MKKLIAFALLFATPIAAKAQDVEPISDLQWLIIEDTVGTLFAAPEDRDRALEVMEKGRSLLLAGQFGEARRLYAEARVILDGGQWNVEREFAASLALHPDRYAIDPQERLSLNIGQHYAVNFPANRSLIITLYARKWQRRPNTDLTQAIRLADIPLTAPDLIETPNRSLIDLSSLQDGNWELVADILEDGTSIGQSTARIFVAQRLTAEKRKIEARLQELDLREGLSASIYYPLDLADGLDLRARRVVNTELRPLLDRSLALLSSAEAGLDPLWQARGNSLRNYRSELSGRIEPFRIFIPIGWDGASELPLAVMLHGSMGDEAQTFAMPEMEQIAQELGIAVLSPLGDDPNSGWGNRLRVVLADGTLPPPRPVINSGKVQAVTSLQPEPAVIDVLESLQRVMEEYPIDPARIYLGGNSMGGEGVWHLAAQYPHLWAAIAAGAGPIDPEAYPYQTLGELPVLVVHGTQDNITSFSASAEMAERLESAGGIVTFSAPNAGHNAFNQATREIFSFFLDHQNASPQPLPPRGETE